MTINRMDFLQAIRRVALANKTTHQVRLRIAGSELNVNAEDLDFANEATERLTCSYHGEDIEIDLIADSFHMLNNYALEEVVLEPSAPNRAGIIRPSEPDELAKMY